MTKRSYNFHRWSTWGILVGAFIIVFFHRLSMGAVADDLSKELGIGGATLGNLTSMTFYSYALMQIPVGIMVDTIGVRKICSIGMALTALGSILFGLSSSIGIAYFSRFIVGIGTSVIIVSIMKVQSQWFTRKKYSTLSGLTSFFGNLGALLATFPLTYLVISLGWRNTFMFLGVITAVLAMGIFILVRDTPEELGFKSVHKRESNKKLIEGIKDVVKNKYTWPNFFIILTLVGSTTAILGLWGISYIVHVYEVTKQQASWYLSFISFGFIAGAPIVGKFSDMLNGEIKRILAISTTIFTLVWIYILLIQKGIPPIEQLPVLFFVIGLCVITHILIFTNVKEVNDLNFSGIATAIVNVGEFVGSALVSLVIGLILERGWSGKLIDGVKVYNLKDYRHAFSFVIIAGIISIIASLVMKDVKETSSETIK
ncbi:MFS transporter [Sporosalibacterium faouarense]|uniref:MFS transporter n=1 Tax=Sporosalibacterium faouarense TaxID=516123 RepID=UPI00141CE21C|nr:MFS transporter [Sporosalibacterium faouarense]MTI47022.1 MFS transporter [Bacillota bacterium]